MRSLFWTVTLGAVGFAAAAACSSTTEKSNDVAYGGANNGGVGGGVGGSNSGGVGAIGGGAGGTISTTGGVGGSGPPRDACAGDFYNGEQKPLDMFIMYDQSGSMDNNGRWDAVKGALTSFVQSPQSADIGVGIAYFPLNPPPCSTPSDTCVCIPFTTICFPTGGGSCLAADYARPDVPIEPLPPVSQKIVDSLNNHRPGGGTPTLPALQGAMEYASVWANGHPDHKTIVVLATDGAPNDCNSDVAGVSNVAAQGLAANPSVQTFVIGVGNTGNMDAIAQAGGTTKAFVVSDQNANQAFLDAMNQIRGTALACDYAIPLPNGQQPNFSQVNIYFTPPGSPTENVIYRVPDASQCDPVNGGWFYDNPQDPKQIRACPASCEQLKSSGGGKVRIEVGCDSLTPPA